MFESGHSLDGVALAFLAAGAGIALAGGLLAIAPAQQGPSPLPVVMSLVGSLAGTFGLFWLVALRNQRLALESQRPGFVRIVTGPRRPDPPSQ